RAARDGLPLRRQPRDVRALPRLQDRAGAHRLHPADAAVLPMSPSGATFNEWHLTLGAGAHLGRAGVALLIAVARLAVAFSALSLIEERLGRGWLLLALRAAGVLACLATALEPAIEERQVVHVPNHVAIAVDASRSMEVRPPDGGPSRAERARAVLERAA